MTLDATCRMQTVDDFVGSVREGVEGRLRHHLSSVRSRAEQAGAAPREVVDALSRLVLRGGKRMRPALLAAAALSVGGRLDADVLEVGAALELLQAYFLVQDDWMDGDDQRRGGPAVHADLAERFGHAHRGASLAILASDLASALAHRALGQVATDPATGWEVLTEFTRVHEQVVFGQVLDLTLGVHDLAAVERMHALKTASYTTVGPVRMGARLGARQRAASLDEALDRYALALGVAFQLRDDLLGTYGDPRQTGKPAASDVREGKRTALVVETFVRLGERERTRFEAALTEAKVSPAAVTEVLSFMESVGVSAVLEARIGELLTTAKAALASVRLEPLGRDVLLSLAELAAHRSA